jgi:hypothetical protein
MPAPASPTWKRVVVKKTTLDTGGGTYFTAGNELMRARTDGANHRLARYREGAWRDEDELSRGLPAVASDPCMRVDRVLGKWPERAWLVANTGGSMTCSSTFGSYTIYRYAKDRWVLDPAHAPKAVGGGVFATWPLGGGALGFGISNLVGDTLRMPTDVMWTTTENPWSTRRALGTKAWSREQPDAACADPSGNVYLFASTTFEVLSPMGARKERDLPQGAEVSSCATDGKTLVTRELMVCALEKTTCERFASPFGAKVTIADVFVADGRVVALTYKPTRSWVADAKAPLGELSSWSELVGFPGEGVQMINVVRVDDATVVAVVEDKELVEVAVPR